MSGLENDVLVAKNVNFDFTSNPPHNGIITQDGQLLIGSATTTPNIAMTAGELTSLDASVTITYDYPNIDLSASGGGSGVIITKYDTPGSFTWSKNVNTKSVTIMMWSGGSGGGSGARYAIGQSPSGGSGAVGPGCLLYDCLGENFASSETVVVGAGGLGGAAITTDDTDGNNGQSGGTSKVGNISTLDENVFMYTSNKSIGGGGFNEFPNAGGYAGPLINNLVIEYISLRGGDSSTSGTARSGNNVPDTSLVGFPRASYLINMTGGGGSGIENITLGSPGNGGSFLSMSDASVLLAGGLAGVSGINNGDGSDGLDGGSISGGILFGGTGGGGGASNLAGRGGNGGNGGNPGGGAGGGAGSNNGFNSGAGGNGGDGMVIIIEYL